MPRLTNVNFYGGTPDEIEGFTFSEYHDAWIPEDDAVGTEHDGVIHGDHLSSCSRCGASVCHESNDGDHMHYVEDRGESWCESCADDHCSSDDDGNLYADGVPGSDTDIPGYHSEERRMDPADEADPFRIGFEVEKEDLDVRRELASGDIGLPSGWVVESDASLDDEKGFEVVTRAYNLSAMDRILRDIESAKGVINADFTTACGGHISISDARYTPSEFADRIRPLFPLVMALYPKRLRNSYSKPIKHKDKDADPDKYRAFAFVTKGVGDRIELRLPSAVKNADSMRFRLALVSHCMLASKDQRLTWGWMSKELAEGGHIHGLLLKAYGDAAKVDAVRTLYTAFAGWYGTERKASAAIEVYLSLYGK